jgi:hypothetical protein
MTCDFQKTNIIKYNKYNKNIIKYRKYRKYRNIHAYKHKPANEENKI